MKKHILSLLLIVALIALLMVSPVSSAVVPNKTKVEKLELATNPDVVLVELAFESDMKMLMAILPLSSEEDATKPEKDPDIIKHLKMAGSPVDLSDYAYLYYDEINEDGKKVTSRIYEVETDKWMTLSLPSSSNGESNGPGESIEVGPYVLEIVGISTKEDFMGKAVLLTFNFTNNSDETQSALWALSTAAYQNGIELDTMPGENTMRNVKSGATLPNVSLAFAPLDNSPVTFEFRESFSYDSEIVELTLDYPEE